MEEKIFVQHQDSLNNATHSGVFVIGWQTQSNGNENVVVTSLSSAFDSQSNAEFQQGTGALLADELVQIGVVLRSDFFDNNVVAESSGSDLRTVASNLVTTIRALGDDWYALLITPQSETLLQQILSDSRTPR